jgi:hypothetical protein
LSGEQPTGRGHYFFGGLGVREITGAAVLECRVALPHAAEEGLEVGLSTAEVRPDSDLRQGSIAPDFAEDIPCIAVETDRRVDFVRAAVAGLLRGAAYQGPHADLLQVTADVVSVGWDLGHAWCLCGASVGRSFQKRVQLRPDADVPGRNPEQRLGMLA